MAAPICAAIGTTRTDAILFGQGQHRLRSSCGDDSRVRDDSGNDEDNERKDDENWPNVETDDQLLNDMIPEPAHTISFAPRTRAPDHLHVVQ